MEKEFIKNNTKLKRIKIYKLFGKKNINLKFENIVKILISENGAGKTTILNIISYLLNGEINNLVKIEFEKIEIQIEKEIIVISKNELLAIDESTDNNIFVRKLLRKIRETDPIIYLDIRRKYREISEIGLRDLYYDIKKYQENHFSKNLEEYFNLLIKEYQSFNKDYFGIENKFETHTKLMKLKKLDLKILYFTTYRRIEKEINQPHKIKELNFGMKDISKKIGRIIDDITKEICEEFNNLNNRMLAKVLADDFSTENDILYQDIETIYNNIEVVVQRLNNNEDYLLENNKNILKNLEKIFENKITGTNKFFLIYLGEMLEIYKRQESKEKKIRDFIDVCNKYLRHKKFNYLADKAIVEIIDEDGRKIEMSSLSSGEKQIVSIFAEIYLEDVNNLFVIIDEPELSIALTWQRMLLPDIIKSQKCKLLLATTHSPFIFDNEFDDYAEDLNNSFE